MARATSEILGFLIFLANKRFGAYSFLNLLLHLFKLITPEL